MLCFFRGVSVVVTGAAMLAAADPLFIVLDLDEGESVQARLANGAGVAVRLTRVSERFDDINGALREARVEVEIAGKKGDVECGNYNLPVAVGTVQVDCTVTRGYYRNTTTDHWGLDKRTRGGLDKRARVRLWPNPSPWMTPGEFAYPLLQRWFATHTQMSNEPTYVDRSETLERAKVYYHSGLDSGGAEGLVDVLAATDATVVCLGERVLAGHEKDTPVGKRYDVIYLLDSRGWYYRYSHLVSFEPGVELGARVRKGQVIGKLGKEGGSGGWSHLHFEIVSRQPSGKWGAQDGYAFLWESYWNERKPAVVAVARPHRVAKPGETVMLDCGKSRSAKGPVERCEWQLSDGRRVASREVQMKYARPGTYSEVLKAISPDGAAAWDFATVNVLDPARKDLEPVTIHAAFHPAEDLKAGQEITFKARTFGTTDGEEQWDFGDGSSGTTRSDGNVVKLAKDGYAVTRHSYARPGDYIVRVSRVDGRGVRAVTHLWLRVGGVRVEAR